MFELYFLFSTGGLNKHELGAEGVQRVVFCFREDFRGKRGEGREREAAGKKKRERREACAAGWSS
jgi:hypothetical protein